MKTVFSDGRIVIRPYQAEDVPLLYAAARESLHELSAWMPWCSDRYSMEDSDTFVATRQAEWESGEHYSFAITDAAEGAFLGGVGLNFVNRVHSFANLGYWVRTSRTGRGIASAATRLIARFGLEELKFKRLEIVVAVGNAASQRVAEKAGAKREGVLRKRLIVRGEPRDAVLYSLVAEDLRLST